MQRQNKIKREGTSDNLKCMTCEVACRALPPRADTTIPRYMKDTRREGRFDRSNLATQKSRGLFAAPSTRHA